MVWLSHHHFEGLRERIFDSDELQRELTALLQQDLSVLGFRLDTIAGVISAVADKIDIPVSGRPGAGDGLRSLVGAGGRGFEGV